MLAFQWSRLPRIVEVERDLDVGDVECLKEVAAVLKRHGREWRFGVNLLHSHFEIGKDEVLIETSDPSDKSLWIRPVPKSEVEGEDVIATAWCLGDGEPRMGCLCKKAGNDHFHDHKR
ncbi:MAG TPA: hypothetical protein VJ750_02915 [Rhizomicrobium sp.]|nr:hypothetical protein [Rhizomicrobium sp.]